MTMEDTQRLLQQLYPTGQTATPLGVGAGAGVGAGVGEVAAGAAPGLLGRATGTLGGLSSGAKGLFENPTLGKANLLKGAAYGIGGQLAGNFIGDQLGGDSSTAGRFAQGAGTGAGFGAAAGSVFPVIGTGLGAAAGAALGGTYNALFGGKKKSNGGNLVQIINDSPIDQDVRSQLLAMYKVLKQTGDEKTAAQTVGQMLVSEIQNGQAEVKSQKDAQAKMLATQALTSQFFQPFTKQLLDSAQMRYQGSQKLMDQLPEQYRAVAQQQNIASLDNATRLANAYSAQAQLIPAMATVQQQVSLQNQLAQQQLMAAMSGKGSGGGGLADLLASVGAGG